jgi:hypothetical protein
MLSTGKDFATICESAELDGPERDLLAQHSEPRAFIGALIEQDLFRAAASVVAHALPTRVGVFWAWSCARDAAGASPGEAAERCLTAARAWICEPTDARRREAFALAREDGFASAASMACAAAFCSGGSLVPDTMPPVLPDPRAAARAIRDCVVMAAVTGRIPDTIEERYRVFLTEGMRITERARALEPLPPQAAWSQAQQ